MPEQTAYLSYRIFLFVSQRDSQVLPDRMVTKMPDTSPVAYGAREFWPVHVSGASLGAVVPCKSGLFPIPSEAEISVVEH